MNRELFHAQWRILLDDDFVQAYCHGIVVDCFDGVRRRFYPRILTYAADYPERWVTLVFLGLLKVDMFVCARVVVVGIRNLGDHPCPRCLVALSDVHEMGTPKDMAMRSEQCRKDDPERKKKVDDARAIIRRHNYSVNTDEVEKLLKPTSLVPSRVSIL